MLKLKGGRVQLKSGGCTSSVQQIAQDGQALGGRVDAYLVGPPGDGLCLQPRLHSLPAQHPKMCFRPVTLVCQGPGPVAISAPHDLRQHGEGLPWNRPVGHQRVLLFYLPLRELPGQGAIGFRSLAENHQAARILVESMQDRQPGPARFAMLQPVVNSFAGMDGGCVRVPARRLVDDQQVVVLVNDAGRNGLLRRRRCHRFCAPGRPDCEIEGLDLCSRPGSPAQELQAGGHARIIVEATDRDAAAQLLEAQGCHQLADDRLKGNAMQRVIGLWSRGHVRFPSRVTRNALPLILPARRPCKAASARSLRIAT